MSVTAVASGSIADSRDVDDSRSAAPVASISNATGSATMATATGRRLACSSAMTLADEDRERRHVEEAEADPETASSSGPIPRKRPRAATAHISS